MDQAQLDTLTGHIDAIGQALLRVVSHLEMRDLIDGPRIAAEWRRVRPEHLAADAELQASRKVLYQLADLLDEARQARAAYQGDRPGQAG
ncbi:hypothetical protein C8C94_0773 [Acidovorax sp. 94]|jgi:hypothetical protein|uniref:hypothetical protein n=1 Tax=Acidovorax sp. 94 TaxID=2135633 RepID=UPI000F2026F9|nr:hypothetical protein [Acidovorax sp. 94]RKR66317.1 hypothetical protein C8C94_0773 [Acidovorax sp. 94]